VQWGTGNIGRYALREVIRHPALDLVGVRVYDPGKDGVDAGVLCDEAPVGVTATTDPADIHALGADCVLHMPSALELDELVALLDAGTNVITTRGEMFAGGRRLDGEQRTRVQTACTKGGSSIYATGSSPGFITDALPFALLSLQRRVELIDIQEFANLSRRPSPELLFGLMGFGRSLDSYDAAARSRHLLGEFGPPLDVLMEAAGRRVDRWRSEGEVAATRAPTAILAGEIDAGAVAAQRTTIVGEQEGVEVVRFSATWYCTEDLDPAWDLGPTGWRVRVRGDAPLAVELPFPIALDDMAATTPAYTANRPVNAVPYVCEAPAGILSTADLPPILPGRR
jgi:4-hydroxy-tetrahydrodipicolinate reductase